MKTRTLSTCLALILLCVSCSSETPGSENLKQQETTSSTTTTIKSSTTESTETTEDSVVEINQGIDWSACYGIYECGDLQVPLSYTDIGSGSISIALVRLPATSEPYLGPLLMNPGGPGGSGVELVGEWADIWEMVFPNFDVIGFDPRGVGSSSQVSCPNDPDSDENWLQEDEEDTTELFIEATEYVEECLDMSGELFYHIGTNNVARDMDSIRAALGAEKINYLGYSYGTRIGAVYASLFPERVRAMVLDGPVSPDEHPSAFSPIQGLGFENAWSRFSADCDARVSCALNEYGGAEEALFAATNLLKDVNIPAENGRELTRSEFVWSIGAALYSPYLWTDLEDGIVEVLEKEIGVISQRLVDDYEGREEDGTYDNSSAVSFIVNCTDDPLRPTEEEIIEAVDAVADQLNHFGSLWRSDTACYGMPPSLDPLHVEEANLETPALVIALEGDPATPMGWARGLTDSIGQAVLITSNGEGHGAFLTNSQCVTDTVLDYFFYLDVPVEGWSCEEPN
ncbi:MAG TPA: alpha/beta hydrolase [Acidimicrobiales bacterium]|nr:alpha/beta hydrolase [Acidimicrobiales bacterium]|tara:strand:+ start:996 stop:2534 length:1539 start_codon:yes stop_codon:yes gene_type:complete